MKYYTIKLVSKVSKRNIAIRDQKRFHHFEEGVFLHGLLVTNLKNSEIQFKERNMHLLEGFYMIPFYLLYSELYGNINEKTLDKPKQFSSFAKCTTIEEKLLALKPKNLDFVQAAGLPLTIETTYDGLERTGFSVGELILVLGGVGGVGSLVI